MQENIQLFREKLRVDKSFDLVEKQIQIGDCPSTLYFIDGFIKDDIMEYVIEFLLSIKVKPNRIPIEEFLQYFITYVEATVEYDIDKAITAVLSGSTILWIEGYPASIIIDARTYPARSTQEPEDDKILRGSRDGFTETMIFNTALIRRRIRTPQLTMHYMSIGKESKTDIVVSYIDKKVDSSFLQKVIKKLSSIQIDSLTLSQESLAECLFPKQWYNPFPKVRYTERPDSASACLYEGKIIVIVDNSPAVLILPTSIFDFFQDTNDYYFPVMIGSYLKIIRMIVFLLSIVGPPIWLLLQNSSILPTSLQFLKVTDPINIPLFFQLIMFEIIIDALKLASLNTPSSLSNSFSVVGALILGEFATKTGVLVPQVVLLMAMIAITNFTQPSFELGYALKFSRIFLLIWVSLFHNIGFIIGIVCIILLICSTKTLTNTTYLYPLYPFNKNALLRVLFRRSIHKDNS